MTGAAHYQTTARQPAIILEVGQRWCTPDKPAREVVTLWPAGAMADALVRIRQDGCHAVVIPQLTFRKWITRCRAVLAPVPA